MSDEAAILLAGGRSSRMGRSKAALDWDGETLLHRTASMLRRTVDGPVVVVGAPGEELPVVPAGVEVVTDPVSGRGPLQGIATGLAAVADRAVVAFVCATDLPLLQPAYVRRVLALLEPDVDVVLPTVHGFGQTLAAGYRTALVPLIDGLLDAGRARPPDLFTRCRVVRPDEAALLADPELAAADPRLDSVINVNTPEEFAAARNRVDAPRAGGAAR